MSERKKSLRVQTENCLDEANSWIEGARLASEHGAVPTCERAIQQAIVWLQEAIELAKKRRRV